MISNIEGYCKAVPALKTVEKEEAEYGIPIFIQDIWKNVFQYSKSDLVALSCVSGWLNKSVRAHYKNYEPEGCFGLKEWNKWCANIENPSPIPLRMIQNFDPLYWMLTFIPENIKGKPLNLSSINRFVSECKNGKDNFKSNYNYSLTDFSAGTIGPFKSHWVLLSKDVLGGKDLENGTRNKNYEIQKILVEERGYEIPHLLDVITSLFMHNLRSGEFLYPLNPNAGELSTFTVVQEKNKEGKQIIVGGYSLLYLLISVIENPQFQTRRFGAACALRSIGY